GIEERLDLDDALRMGVRHRGVRDADGVARLVGERVARLDWPGVHRSVLEPDALDPGRLVPPDNVLVDDRDEPVWEESMSGDEDLLAVVDVRVDRALRNRRGRNRCRRRGLGRLRTTLRRV